jgi:hypothetical protein
MRLMRLTSFFAYLKIEKHRYECDNKVTNSFRVSAWLRLLPRGDLLQGGRDVPKYKVIRCGNRFTYRRNCAGRALYANRAAEGSFGK